MLISATIYNLLSNSDLFLTKNQVNGTLACISFLPKVVPQILLNKKNTVFVSMNTFEIMSDTQK